MRSSDLYRLDRAIALGVSSSMLFSFTSSGYAEDPMNSIHWCRRLPAKTSDSIAPGTEVKCIFCPGNKFRYTFLLPACGSPRRNILESSRTTIKASFSLSSGVISMDSVPFIDTRFSRRVRHHRSLYNIVDLTCTSRTELFATADVFFHRQPISAR